MLPVFLFIRYTDLESAENLVSLCPAHPGLNKLFICMSESRHCYLEFLRCKRVESYHQLHSSAITLISHFNIHL